MIVHQSLRGKLLTTAFLGGIGGYQKAMLTQQIILSELAFSDFTLILKVVKGINCCLIFDQMLIPYELLYYTVATSVLMNKG